jgi:hypothetical protein
MQGLRRKVQDFIGSNCLCVQAPVARNDESQCCSAVVGSGESIGAD